MAITLYQCANCGDIVGCVFIGSLCRYCRLNRGGVLGEKKPDSGIRLVLPDGKVLDVSLSMGEIKDETAVVDVRPIRKFRFEEA